VLAGFAAFAALVVPCVGALAQGLAPRQDVLFEVNQTTAFGASVFVVGDLPELGSNNTANAVKLSPAAYPVWRATLSLPAGRSTSYRYVVRSDSPGQQGTFATTVAGPFTLNVPDQPRATRSKALWLTWNIDRPVMWWRPASSTSGGAFIARPMQEFGPAAAGRINDRQWLTWGFHIAGEAFDFYFTDSNGNFRYPASGFYSTNMDGVFVQDGQLYSYVPAANPGAARRDYNPASPPTLFFPRLNQTRAYRVFLPRGYEAHPQRRYPLVFFHDGQNVFDQGTFGTWNAGATLADLQATGQMQEVIAVALDNVGETRRSDYSPPGDNNGRADQYIRSILEVLKPHIDGGYRTINDASTTGAIGSSMGGVVSLSMGYDWGDSFRRIGALSTAWWLVPNFTNYVRGQPGRAGLRISMDVGDSGSTSGGNNFDGYWDSLGVRDNFIGGLQPKYALSGAYAFSIGYGQNHSEAAWASRLPTTLRFLYPSQGELNDLLRTVFSPTWDVTADGRVDVEDLYAISASPRDVNFDGVAGSADAELIEKFGRRAEFVGMVQP
jgi:predicted alpha/beta superfamily hydrolase